MCICGHARIYICMYVCVCMCVGVHIPVEDRFLRSPEKLMKISCKYMYVCVCMCIYMYVCVYVYVCVCMCVGDLFSVIP